MKATNRREFLQSSALLLAGALVSLSFDNKQYKPKLAFSSLGCPDWSLQQMVGFAVAHGYQGLELRGLSREMDLTRCPEFSTPQQMKDTLRLMKDSGLQFVGLGSSANLHIAGPAERKKNLDEGRRFLDLAGAIGCPYVRVFPNNFPKDQDKNQTMELITEGLLELAEHAKGAQTTVLLETHGDLVHSGDLLTVMQGAGHPNAGLVWDISNMWTVTREKPSEVYRKLRKYIRHTHVKDARIVDGKPSYTLLGEGEVPVASAITELVRGGYNGYFSFEWEKLWHPELAAPEIAMAHFPKAFRTILKQL
ncbi:MAG TPA: sugar phosphate isomerase/epimerase family protein [Sphingobacteriaceae bacterium]